MDNERLDLPSASAFRRYELCAGSYQLEQEAKLLGQLAHQGSPAAQRGSLIHAYLAGIPDEDGNQIKLDEDEQRTADFLQERSQDQVQRIFADRPWLQLEEKRLWLTHDGKKIASGKFDRCVYSVDGKLALVQDFKSGQSEPIPAEINSQLQMLAVLIGLALPSVEEIVAQVVTVFYGVSERRFSIKDLAQAYREVNKTLRAIQAPDASLVPGALQCQYCPALLICSAAKSLAPPIMKTEVSKLPDGLGATELLGKIEILEGLITEIKKYYSNRLIEDPSYTVPDYVMKPGNIIRTVTDWKTALARLGEYLDDEQLNGAADFGIAKIESALAKVLKLTTEQAKEKLNQILSGLIKEKQNKPSLKRTGSKLIMRPSIAGSGAVC